MKICNKSAKLHCYFSTQKSDDSITRYFPFSKKEFPNKNWMLCLHNAWEIFRKLSWLYYLYLQVYNWWVLFIQVWGFFSTFIKSSGPLWKNPVPPFYSLRPLKLKNCKSHSFCQHWKLFSNPPPILLYKGEWTLCGTDIKPSSNPVKSNSVNQSKISSKFQRRI